MEQLEHIFRRTQCAWYNVGKLEEVCKKVETTTKTIYARLNPSLDGTTSTEGLIRLVDGYRTLETLVSEFQWRVRVTGTMITAIPISQDRETLMDAVTKTSNYAQRHCTLLAKYIFEGGQRLNPSPVFLLQRKLYIVYCGLVQRDVDSFLAEINDPAWITDNCSEEWSRQNVLTFLDLLIGDVEAVIATPKKYAQRGKRKNLLSTTLPALSEAREKVRAMGPGEHRTVPPPTGEMRENMERGESVERMETEDADKQREEKEEITDPKHLAEQLWIQYGKSFFAYRTLWTQFVWSPDKITREELPENYAKMEDEQRKLSWAFDKLSTNFPEGENSPKLNLFKTDMELLFRKTHVLYRTAMEFLVENERLVTYDKELAEHSENVGAMINQLQTTECIKFEELHEYRVFVDSEICFLNNFLFVILEDYIAACHLEQTPMHAYKIKHNATLQLLRTCEWLKYFLSLESTVFCNNPLWNKILCDGRRMVFESADRSRTHYGLFVLADRMVSFVRENGVIKESENTSEVVDKVFRPLWAGRKVSLEVERKVPAETLLNLLMRKLEKSASRDAAEFAFDQLGLMGTFTRDRLTSVFPADSPLLTHLLGHLSKKVEEIPEKGTTEMVQKVPDKIQGDAENIQKAPKTVSKVPNKIQKASETVPNRIQKVAEKIHKASRRVRRARNKIQKASEKVQKTPEMPQKVPDKIQNAAEKIKSPETIQKARVKTEYAPGMAENAYEKDFSSKNAADGTIPKVSAVSNASRTLVAKKNAVTIEMPDVKPNIKAMSTTVVKKEVETAPENMDGNTATHNVTTNFNWYINVPPSLVPTNSEVVDTSPRNNKYVSNHGNNVRTISENVFGTNAVDTLAKDNLVGSIPQNTNSNVMNTNSEGVVATNMDDGNIASRNDNIASSNDNIASRNDNIASSNDNIESSNGNTLQPETASEIPDTVTVRDVVEALYKRPITM